MRREEGTRSGGTILIGAVVQKCVITTVCLFALLGNPVAKDSFEALRKQFDADNIKIQRAYHAAKGDFSKITVETTSFSTKLDRVYVPRSLEFAQKLPRPAERLDAMMFALHASLMLDPKLSKVSSLENSWKFLLHHRQKFGPLAETAKRARFIGSTDPRMAELMAPLRSGKFGQPSQEALMYADALLVGGPNAAEDSRKQLEALVKAYPKSPYALDAKSVLELRKKLQAGQTAPGLKFKTITGSTFSTKAESGKVVLIDFWGFWCPGCVQELDELKAIRAKFPNAKLTILSVSTDSWPPAYFAERAREAGLNWNHSLPGSTSSEAVTPLGVSVYPAKLIIDPAGKVVVFGPNYALGDWKAELEKVLQ